MKLSYGKLLIGVAVFGVCLGMAFAAGTVYGRHSTTNNANAASLGTFNRASNSGNRGTGAAGAQGDASTSAASAAQSGTPQAAFPLGGRQGFLGGFGGRPIEAKVDSVNGQQLQVMLGVGANGGNSTAIALNSQTTYATANKADKSALKTGANVYVTTAAASDGTVIAQSVIILPPGQTTTANQGSGSSAQSSTGGSGTTGATGGQGFGGSRGFGGGANRPIDGTVASVNGNTLQVTLASGSTSSVTLGDQTTYATTKTADQSAVTAGSSVLLTISRGSDGSLSAQSVIVLPASGQTS